VEYWKNIKTDVVKETARKVIGHKQGSIKEKWISNSASDAIDERRLLKAKKEQVVNTGKQSSDVVDAYRHKDKRLRVIAEMT